MNRDEAVALFLQGREAWNVWAERLLIERKAIEEEGRWLTAKEQWLEAAKIDFSNCGFLAAQANTSPAKDSAKDPESLNRPVIQARGEEISFRGFLFPGTASFLNASFSGDVSFAKVNFLSNAMFDFAEFSGNADLSGANFSGAASFWNIFAHSHVNFANANFAGYSEFGKAHFCGDRPTFAKANFPNGASFYGAKFWGSAEFVDAKVDRSFNMSGVEFTQVPGFNQADFRQAPDLDDVKFPLPSFWRRGKAEFIPQYRAIRRIAVQGADYEREQMALKGEIRSKRGTEHRLYHAGFWYGLLYDALSDFGRSTWRPLIAWLACIAIFAVYFLGQTEGMTSARAQQPELRSTTPVAYLMTAWDALWSSPYCYPGTKPLSADPKEGPDDRFTGLVEKVRASTTVVNEAFSIAYHNAVIVLDSSGDSVHRAYGCLYGVERYGGNPVAYVPRNVAIASGIQKVLSAVFIFLFGLALRNMLKVK